MSPQNGKRAPCFNSRAGVRGLRRGLRLASEWLAKTNLLGMFLFIIILFRCSCHRLHRAQNGAAAEALRPI